MSGKNSAEYKAFFRNQAQIADTISDINGLNDIIVAKLRAMKIIGKTEIQLTFVVLRSLKDRGFNQCSMQC